MSKLHSWSRIAATAALATSIIGAPADAVALNSTQVRKLIKQEVARELKRLAPSLTVGHANTSGFAASATNAVSATSAVTAGKAISSITADTATKATTANTANTAVSATFAGLATRANATAAFASFGKDGTPLGAGEGIPRPFIPLREDGSRLGFYCFDSPTNVVGGSVIINELFGAFADNRNPPTFGLKGESSIGFCPEGTEYSVTTNGEVGFFLQVYQQ